MHLKGPSEVFFWPKREDICWVPAEHILEVIQAPQINRSGPSYALKIGNTLYFARMHETCIIKLPWFPVKSPKETTDLLVLQKKYCSLQWTFTPPPPWLYVPCGQITYSLVLRMPHPLRFYLQRNDYLEKELFELASLKLSRVIKLLSKRWCFLLNCLPPAFLAVFDGIIYSTVFACPDVKNHI